MFFKFFFYLFLLLSVNNIIILRLLCSPSKPTDSWVVPFGAVRLLWTPTLPTHNCRHTARLSLEPALFVSLHVSPSPSHTLAHTQNDHIAVCQPPLCLVVNVCVCMSVCVLQASLCCLVLCQDIRIKLK